MQTTMGLHKSVDILQPCFGVTTPFRPARSSFTEQRRCQGAHQQICTCAWQQQHSTTAEEQSCIPCRRAVLHAAASIAVFAAAAPATALVEGFTPMTSLKGKDYGKARMRYLAMTRRSTCSLHMRVFASMP
jgi:hypothetical protein